MNMTTPWLLLWAWTVLSVVYVAHGSSNSQSSRSVQVLNDSGYAVSLYWIHPKTKEATLMSMPTISNGALFPLDSFVGHEFEIRPPDDFCSNNSAQECQSNSFVVTSDPRQVVTISSEMELLFENQETLASRQSAAMIDQCQEQSKSIADIEQAMEHFAKCVESGVASRMEKANEEIAYQATVRKDMATLVENYTCADYDLPTTPSLEEYEWVHKGDTHPVEVKHRREASQIHVIHNFITPDECQAMQDAAEPKLHVATVADGKGGSQFSENRKAMQAGITVPWHLEAEGEHIAQLSRRVYDYTNHVLGLDIDEKGQEDLMSIQYFGRGLNDTSPDRYTPHCDGDCTGLKHKIGTRMATMVMYCTLPQVGGATNFRNAGVHIMPREGSAIFFSYINPETKIMDTGFTEHSGCPVMEGEKKIVTQWIRYGVDEDNPWDSLNTLGIRRSDAEDQ